MTRGLKPPKLPGTIKTCADDGLAICRYIQPHDLVFVAVQRVYRGHIKTVPNLDGRVITSGDKKVTVADKLDARNET